MEHYTSKPRVTGSNRVRGTKFFDKLHFMMEFFIYIVKGNLYKLKAIDMRFLSLLFSGT